MADETQARAGVYARQSSNKHKSIAEQISECVADAVEQGWTVAERYQDGSSASRFARKTRDDWARVLADITAGRLDVLILWESSRGDRTLTTWSGLLDLCRERGVRIRVVTHEHTYNLAVDRDWRTLASEGVTSASESNVISVRVKRGHAGAAAKGRPAHGRTPFGYTRTYDPQTGDLDRQEIDPATAPIVREIITRIARGEPISTITDDLETRNVPTPGARRWYRQRVIDLARNPAYVGQRVHNGQTYPATWPALVDPVIWYAAQRVLTDPARVTTRPGRQRHLLSYLAECACGSPMCAVRGRYRCLRPRAGCTTIVQADTDEFVTDLMIDRLSKPDTYAALRQASETADREVIEAREKVAELRNQLDGWRRSAADGKTTPESLAAIEAQLVKDIRAAEAREKQAGVPLALREILVPGEDVRERWAAAPLPIRREAIRLFMVVCITSANRPGSRSFESERVQIRWR